MIPGAHRVAGASWVCSTAIDSPRRPAIASKSPMIAAEAAFRAASSGDRRSMVNTASPGITLTAPGSARSCRPSRPIGALRPPKPRRSTASTISASPGQRIAAELHGHGARMVRRTADAHDEPGGPVDTGDDADAQVLRLQHRPLLDMGLHIGQHLVRPLAAVAIASGSPPKARSAPHTRSHRHPPP